MTDRPAAARRPVRTAPRRGAARTPGRPTAAPERRYALIKWALLAALVAYAVLVVGANDGVQATCIVITDCG